MNMHSACVRCTRDRVLVWQEVWDKPQFRFRAFGAWLNKLKLWPQLPPPPLFLLLVCSCDAGQATRTGR